jgi:CRP-like cAMP-binding protein
MTATPTTAQKLLLLRASPVFCEVPVRSLRAASERFEFRRYEAGESIFRKGDEPESLYVVSSGRVAIEQGDDRPVRIAELDRGEIFGEMSLLARHRHRRSAIAVTAALVLAIDGDTFLRLGARHPEILIGTARSLADRVDEADRWLQRHAVDRAHPRS